MLAKDHLEQLLEQWKEREAASDVCTCAISNLIWICSFLLNVLFNL